jgi:hypothetical protein
MKSLMQLKDRNVLGGLVQKHLVQAVKPDEQRGDIGIAMICPSTSNGALCEQEPSQGRLRTPDHFAFTVDGSSFDRNDQ